MTRNSLTVVVGTVLLSVFVLVASVPSCGQIPTEEEAAKLAQPGLSRFTSYQPADTCQSTGAHEAHGKYACATCHFCAGTVSFDPAGPAVSPGKPAPAFDATAKTCSNVACHGVPAGTYTYSYWDYGSDSLAWTSVPYGGTAGSTPNWYSTGLGCLACHDLKYNGTAYQWHTGQHGLSLSQTIGNSCQTCHPDATGLIQLNGTIAPGAAITDAAAHANGTLNVDPKWRSGCSNCH